MSKQYTPAAPTNGHYLAKILSVQEDANAIFIFYDISVGRSVGWAHSYYLSHSRWPLVQRIDKKTGKTILAQLLRYANAREIRSVVGASICIEIALERHLNIRCIHSREYYSISSSDIKLGTSSWATGSPDLTRAVYLADLSNLPVLYCDVHERLSPMVNWCAENQIILLPSLFATGDYTAADSDVIVDRKQNMEELIHDFCSSTNAATYHLAANRAAAMGKKLIYITGVADNDNICSLNDIVEREWTIPRYGKISGAVIVNHLNSYMAPHPNASFLFYPQSMICEKIYEVVTRKRNMPCLRQI